MRAATAGDARQAFNAYRLPGVLLNSVEPIEPDTALPSSTQPDSPFSPLVARRRANWISVSNDRFRPVEHIDVAQKKTIVVKRIKTNG